MNKEALIRQCTDNIDNVIYCEAVESLPDGYTTVFVLHKDSASRRVSIFRNHFSDLKMDLVQSVSEPLHEKISQVFCN